MRVDDWNKHKVVYRKRIPGGERLRARADVKGCCGSLGREYDVRIKHAKGSNARRVKYYFDGETG